MAGKLSRHMANTPFQKAYNNSIRIARTEGHRIQVQSALDAQHVAKSKGADIVKQWDANLDGATREHHQMLDGQIREVDEPFEVGGRKVEAPGMFGDPAEDCNCRCCLLQRARWALDDEELQTLKDRAAYFNLDKTDEFEEYQRKYLGIDVKELEDVERKIRTIEKNIKYAVPHKIIENREYVQKFDNIADTPEERREYYKAAKEILTHRSGQNGEDLYLYDTKNKKWHKSVTGNMAGTPEYTEEILKAIKTADRDTLVSFHNHPSSMPPSVDDINAASQNGYKMAYVLCHDGKIYRYSTSERYIGLQIYELRIARYRQKGYNEFKAQRQTIIDLSKEYGFLFEEVT